MTKRTALALCCAGLLSLPAFAVEEPKKPSCCAKKSATDDKSAVKPATRMRCTLTGKEVDKCCCEKRDGKLYCRLAKKAVEKCCCEEVKEQAKNSAA
jgi:hypothetical protein